MKQLIVLEPEVKKSASSRRRHFQIEHTKQRSQGCLIRTNKLSVYAHVGP